MKVYIVQTVWDYDASEIRGVFKDPLDAELLVEELINSEVDHAWLEEWEVE